MMMLALFAHLYYCYSTTRPYNRTTQHNNAEPWGVGGETVEEAAGSTDKWRRVNNCYHRFNTNEAIDDDGCPMEQRQKQREEVRNNSSNRMRRTKEGDRASGSTVRQMIKANRNEWFFRSFQRQWFATGWETARVDGDGDARVDLR